MASTITLAEFIASNGLTMDTQWTESNPSMVADEWSRSASHYLCTIHRGDEFMSLYFSMGAALTEEPTLEMVLDAVASDVAGVANNDDWLDWADELGYEFEGAESMKAARATYETISRQGDELRDLIGPDAVETLLWNTERL